MKGCMGCMGFLFVVVVLAFGLRSYSRWYEQLPVKEAKTGRVAPQASLSKFTPPPFSAPEPGTPQARACSAAKKVIEDQNPAFADADFTQCDTTVDKDGNFLVAAEIFSHSYLVAVEVDPATGEMKALGGDHMFHD